MGMSGDYRIAAQEGASMMRSSAMGERLISAMRDRLKNLLGLNGSYLDEYDEVEGVTKKTRRCRDCQRHDGRNRMNTVGSGLKPKLVIHEPSHEIWVLDDIKNRNRRHRF